MLGSSLCNLLDSAHDVFAFHRDTEDYVKCKESINVDLLKYEKLKTEVTKIKPNIIIHCSGLTNVEECELNYQKAYDQNALVTEYIARLCKDKIKLIYISTDQIYGSDNNYIESIKDYKPLNNYGKTKLEGEKKVLQFCKNHIIIRTNIFGWNVKKGRLSSAEWMYDQLKKHKEITLFSDYYFMPIYTVNLGLIIQKLFDSKFNGNINIGSSLACSKYEFGKFLAKKTNYDSKLILKGSLSKYPFRASRYSKLIFNYSSIYDLGIKLPDFKESVINFIKDRMKNV